MSKTVRLPDDVYERVEAHQREGESLVETIDRLAGGRSLRELVGILSDDEAEEMRGYLEDLDKQTQDDLDETAARFTSN
ncbi:antitoxin VapB family protein [Halomarina salina]|uniref:Antitoxin VapB family protein n=1 Tax=Halomarina salina TaxID=1872699 RepID=A0ABD5RNR1_9EURY|nr:antitoxin VapB family protein [Halomarina salina]